MKYLSQKLGTCNKKLDIALWCLTKFVQKNYYCLNTPIYNIEENFRKYFTLACFTDDPAFIRKGNLFHKIYTRKMK